MLGRETAAAAYDTKHGAVVLFGGSCVLLGSVSCPGAADLNDTWTWTSTSKTWTLGQANTATPTPSQQPSQRTGAMMAFDSTRNQVILFGGFDGTNYLNDTWYYNFSSGNWTQLNASNCASASLPACRAYGAIGRDFSGTVVLFGGSNTSGYLGDTWTWNGSSWSSYALASPTARAMASMGFFNKPGGGNAQGLMLFGGQASGTTCPSGVCGDTWTWQSSRWQNLYATGSTGSPTARYDAAAATDVNGGVVIFGGTDGTTLKSDTWRLS
jgi:hypothetical protein